MSFVHLHVHSQYSLLKSTVRIEDLFEQAKQFGMPAVALTDYGNLHGSGEFLEKAKTAGVQPLIGVDITVVHGDAKEKSTKYPSFSLVLLAETEIGVKNLYRLVSLANLEGFYYKPRIDLSMLKEHHDGLIALSGNHFGAPSKMIQDHRLDLAESTIQQYVEIFGKNNYYLELIDTGLKIQKTINEAFVQLSKKLDVPVVASNDVHYLSSQDARAHDVLLCVGSGKQLNDPGRLKFQTEEFYFRSVDEMREKFGHVPQALDNTLAIAQRCRFDSKKSGYRMPRFELPEGKSAETYLQELSKIGLRERLQKIIKAKKTDESAQDIESKYLKRLELELDVIAKTGFASYFLIVQDFINYAKRNNIPVGPGRGSAAGSLVAYATNITDIDPIPYSLLFERFLNPERISMPDIDVDFCQYRRDEVIDYVCKKYDGEGVSEKRVAQICTFGKMQARAAIRDVGRVLGLPYGDVDRIAKLVPAILNISLDDAFEQEPKFNELRQKDPAIDDLLSLALFVEGLPRHASVHAAGVVISDEKPLVDHLPLMRGQEEEIVTQWDMKGVEKIGLVKLDFLGLKTLTLLQRAVELVQESKGKTIDLLYLDLNDPKVYELLSRGETQGIFQLESSGMRDLVVKLKPSSFEDIVALVALYRPGPLGSGMVDDFINRKHGRTPIVYDLPELEPILKDTYGVILYQEQVMQIASALASYTMGEADLLRRAMGKKIHEEMEAQKNRFLEGARKNKIPEAKAQKIFDLMAKFAGYGFNKSHSAAYALISYQTAYLKTYFPVEFMAACLSIDRGNSDRVVLHLADCRKQNIEVLPPDINQSDLDFRVIEQKIRFGLAAIKNVGEIAIRSVLDSREQHGTFRDLFDLCKRVELRQVNKKVLEALIKCGAMDTLGIKRSQGMANLEKILDVASKHQKDEKMGQTSLFGSFASVDSVALDDAEEWDESLRLRFEKESVGFYISGHPLLKYQPWLDLFANSKTTDLIERKNQSTVRLGGIISTLKEISTKKGDRMAFATLEDLQGQTEVVLFPESYRAASELIKSEQPVYIIGKVDIGEDQAKVLADKVSYLEQASEIFDGRILIHISADQLQDQDLVKMKELLTRHRGPCGVTLYMSVAGKSQTKLSLPKDYALKPSSVFFEELRSVLPSSRIELI